MRSCFGWLGIAVAAMVVPCTPAWGAAAVEGGKVYSGSDGISVTIVNLAPRSQNKAIVLVQGSDTELDGKALLHDVKGEGDRMDYQTQLHGRDWVTVAVRKGWGSRQLILGVPGRRDDISVGYDEKRTQELKPEEVYALHQKQSQDGSLAALQAFDRQGEEARHGRAFNAALESMNRACATQVTGTVEWKSVSDDLVKRYSISSFCANPLAALERLCASAEAKAVIQRKVKALTCQFGATLELKVKDGTLRWVTAPEAANQEEFATRYFEKNL
jgi:hypothetical protein